MSLLVLPTPSTHQPTYNESTLVVYILLKKTEILAEIYSFIQIIIDPLCLQKIKV